MIRSNNLSSISFKTDNALEANWMGPPNRANSEVFSYTVTSKPFKIKPNHGSNLIMKCNEIGELRVEWNCQENNQSRFLLQSTSLSRAEPRNNSFADCTDDVLFSTCNRRPSILQLRHPQSQLSKVVRVSQERPINHSWYQSCPKNHLRCRQNHLPMPRSNGQKPSTESAAAAAV